MNKIVRLELEINKFIYTVDNSYDDQKTNQENCDAALRGLHEAMKNKQAVALTRWFETSDNKQASIPALLNLGLVTEVLIKSAKVYDVKEKEETDGQT